MSCYCGLSENFELCCARFHKSTAFASTPEQLMRARYSAYATKDAAYLFHTTAKSKQTENSLNDIAQWANQTLWLKLTITDANHCNINNFDEFNPPAVQFAALYQHENKFYQMTERSIFIVENGQWKYHSGDILVDEELAAPKRNDLCLCQSGKKFKRCCAQ